MSTLKTNESMSITMRLWTVGLSLATAVIVVPFLANAQTISNTLTLVSKLLNGVIGLFITLAIVVFFWGLIKYLWSMGPEDAHQGIKVMFWGIIAVFVMVSIWGIIALLQRSFSVQGGQAIVPSGIYYNPPR